MLWARNEGSLDRTIIVQISVDNHDGYQEEVKVTTYKGHFSSQDRCIEMQYHGTP